EERNCRGNTKWYWVRDHLGRWVHVHGKLEKMMAETLTRLGIRWRKETEGFPYKLYGTFHTYFPDFYLLDHDLYIETKGWVSLEKYEKDCAKIQMMVEKGYNIEMLFLEDIKLLEELTV
ncbi:unnamed protein product, partial [marine sediment metagenome]